MSGEKKTITVGELFTEKELKKAFAIIGEAERKATFLGPIPGQTLNDMLLREVVTPEVMRRIDEKTGHQNHAGYYCYVLQYAYSQTQGTR